MEMILLYATCLNTAHFSLVVLYTALMPPFAFAFQMVLPTGCRSPIQASLSLVCTQPAWFRSARTCGSWEAMQQDRRRMPKQLCTLRFLGHLAGYCAHRFRIHELTSVFKCILVPWLSLVDPILHGEDRALSLPPSTISAVFFSAAAARKLLRLQDISACPLPQVFF